MINILDKSIYNLIAAGEVVERPASIIKELVENSIDAKASNISIDIIDGGIKKIRVTDNGCGIDFSDLSKAFLPHATSKVRVKEDLEKIGTLGFRGEALSSIAAVSKITLVSKTSDQDYGGIIYSEGGEISEVTEKGSPDGTYITVEDIFFNLPARAKFLKSVRGETMEISNLVSRMILSNPDISFKYSNDGEIIYHSDGMGIESALIAVYGKKILENILKINTTLSDIVVSGYIGKPEFSKSNRTYQTLIINKRYVINSMVSKAVSDACGDYLMKNQYPFFIINLSLPLENIDVNVHPNKLDVRFSESDTIYRAVRKAAETALNKNRQIPLITIPETVSNVPINNNTLIRGGRLTDFIAAQRINKINAPLTASEGTLFSDVIRKMQEEITAQANQPAATSDNCNNKQASVADLINETVFAADNTIQQNTAPAKQVSFDIAKRVKKIGELFNTYILIEYDSVLYLIDQHAAHERILYDKYVSEIEGDNIRIQDLLIPYIFEVNHTEYNYITEVMPDLKILGFDIEPIGMRAFKISSVPALCFKINLKTFTDNLLNGQSIVKASDIIKNKVMRAACMAAVKGGDALNDIETNGLIDKFKDNKNVLLCPHGRPVIIQIEKTEIEKWFKRKV